METQAEERAIKVVTESCIAICGIRKGMDSSSNARKKMPKFNTKKNSRFSE